jgi:hypothetical protein
MAVESLMTVAVAPPFNPIAFMAKWVWFFFTLFLKLCFTTALYATLAEMNRRIALFRQGKRPVAKALLLIPVVIVFCTGILLILNLWRIVFSDMNINLRTFNVRAIDLFFAVFRLAFLLAALAIGAALGWIIGRNVRVGKDRFGGVVYSNRGRYLAFWLTAFGICGFFRLMPWGFVTYWTVWLLLLAAAVVTAAHWTLYGRIRAAGASRAPGLPPGKAIDIELPLAEAAVLSSLAALPPPASEQAIGKNLTDGDFARMAHPGLHEATRNLLSSPQAISEALGGLKKKGLAALDGRGWRLDGPAMRLNAIHHLDLAAALTERQAGGARTRILHLAGPTQVLFELGPSTLSIHEVPEAAAAARTDLLIE